MPHTSLADWMKTPEAERKAAEDTMKAQWNAWAAAQGTALHLTAAAGKNVHITAAGATEQSNDLMMYSLVEAADVEAAKKMFVGHPHLEIPGAWIDLMPARKMEM